MVVTSTFSTSHCRSNGRSKDLAPPPRVWNFTSTSPMAASRRDRQQEHEASTAGYPISAGHLRWSSTTTTRPKALPSFRFGAIRHNALGYLPSDQPTPTSSKVRFIILIVLIIIIDLLRLRGKGPQVATEKQCVLLETRAHNMCHHHKQQCQHCRRRACRRPLARRLSLQHLQWHGRRK